ncbi:type II toxin-antitoxin system VapC family toxin [Vibrio nigripulchritudo]|uniref:type II toxin-antitoxin system VapC family toxin n=1 Tax=Vibrio nigripulchritudo TaxID=28173 RepID=UPI0024904C41|nr:PIN domain-containing protein [Vibrio nigripulchritudo]BDU35746.1 hypothetical protein TUMSATVNIG2_02150 [Vibrio nigripulchritudo]BDU41416.1 hypothetical protein TUMSATVNIG3_02140 [Vibrio nigripulchritudo]
MKYILDSNVFDYILDNGVSVNNVKAKGELYITNVQLSEISNIPNVTRRSALEELVSKLSLEKLVLDSGIWLDDLKWDDEQPWRDEVGDECKSLLGNATKNTPWKDALIGEVAKNKELILVTNDQKFAARAKKNDISTVSASEWL